MNASPQAHIRKHSPILDRRGRSRFIERPEPATLCGAPVTSRDWLVSDVRSPQTRPEDVRRFGLCLECYLTIRADVRTLRQGRLS